MILAACRGAPDAADLKHGMSTRCAAAASHRHGIMNGEWRVALTITEEGAERRAQSITVVQQRCAAGST